MSDYQLAIRIAARMNNSEFERFQAPLAGSNDWKLVIGTENNRQLTEAETAAWLNRVRVSLGDARYTQLLRECRS